MAIVIQFPTPRALAERIITAAGGVVIYPVREPETQLTPRERDALAQLGRVPKTSQRIATDLFVGQRRAKTLLASLRDKGHACRIGHYHNGGWIRVEEQSYALAA